MRKIKITILSVILSGLLLCGIGAGVMFYEFSALEYIGDCRLSVPNDKETTELSLKNIPKGTIYINYYGRNDIDIDVKKDETVKDDILKIETTYDKSVYEPDYSINRSVLDSTVNFMYYTKVDEFESFLKMKDVILEDLKNDKIGNYSNKSEIKVTIFASPKIADRIAVCSN